MSAEPSQPAPPPPGVRPGLGGWRALAGAAALAAVYVATGHAGLALAPAHESATLVWPPSGIALAALILGGTRLAPGVFVGALAVNLWNGTPAAPALGIALGNTAEALLGSRLLAGAAFDPRLCRMRDVISLAGLGAAVAPAVAATAGVGSLAAAGLLAPHSPLEVGAVWWLGDAAGILVFSPVLLVAVRGAPAWAALLHPELVAVAASIVLTSTLAFGGATGHELALFAALAGAPLLVWAGLRGGPRGAIVASLLASVPAIVQTTAGQGPLAGTSPLGRVILLVSYCTSLGTTALLLAAATRERDEAERARASAQARGEALAHRVAQAERLEAIGLLAGGVAHDFNNLLTIIRTNAAVAQAATPEAAPARPPLDDVLAASARGAELCKQLLAVGGRIAVRPATFDLRALAEEVVAAAGKHLAPGAAVRLEPGPPVTMAGDRVRMVQLLENLVANGVEALRPSGGTVRVRVDGEAAALDPSLDWNGDPLEPGPHVALEVEDDGAGMSAETRRHLFEPFFSTKGRGRGLGTATVLAAVRAHAGAIAVRSRPGEGTWCRVVLPRGEIERYERAALEPAADADALEPPANPHALEPTTAPGATAPAEPGATAPAEPGATAPAEAARATADRDAVESAAAPSADPASAPQRSGRGRLLLADDEALVRRAMARVLASEGWEVVEAPDGEAALEAFSARPGAFACVVLDVRMPRLDGPAALARMRALQPDLAALLVTGFATERELPDDGTRVLAKPFTPAALLAAIDAELAAARPAPPTGRTR